MPDGHLNITCSCMASDQEDLQGSWASCLVIRCTCLKIAYNSKTVGRRAKGMTFGTGGSYDMYMYMYIPYL